MVIRSHVDEGALERGGVKWEGHLEFCCSPGACWEDGSSGQQPQGCSQQGGDDETAVRESLRHSTSSCPPNYHLHPENPSSPGDPQTRARPGARAWANPPLPPLAYLPILSQTRARA